MIGMLGRFLSRAHRDVFVPPSGQFSALNGLRGISSYLVTCYHAAIFSGHFPLLDVSNTELTWFHRAINGGWGGLDVFFVLSGFLIGRILMTSQKRTDTVEFWPFFVRRSMRIFPAYYLVLTVALFWLLRSGLVETFWFTGGGSWDDLLRNSWQNYTYTFNYFFVAGAPNAMSWSWSLCVEEHFYLLLPLLLALAHRFTSLPASGTVIWVWMVLPFAGRLAQYIVNPDIALMDGFYYRSHNRFDEIVYGVLIAYYYVHHREALERLVHRLGHLTWIIGLTCVGIVWIFGGLQHQGFFAVVVQFNLLALGAGFLVLNGLFLDNAITRFLAHRFWYPIARVSYGIYLVHCYMLFFVIKQAGLDDLSTLGSFDFFVMFLLVMGGSTAVAMTMFVVVERPLLDVGTRLSRRLRKHSTVAAGS